MSHPETFGVAHVILRNYIYMDRIIGQYGGTQSGPLVVAIGAIHGNETAGVQALKEVFQMLEREAVAHPDFEFKGKLVGLIGHRQAFKRGLRFIKQDLNRLWLPNEVQQILEEDPANLRDEQLEIRELYSAVCHAVQTDLPATLVLLDLHTTSATGGIFCIPTDETESLALSRELRAPVILDLFKGVHGTLLRFTTEGHFDQPGFPKRALGAAFEAGQHDDPHSVSRSISAIVHCLRAVGCIPVNALSSHHDVTLQESSAGLPEVTRLHYVHRIVPGDHFKMRPGYLNFQPIHQGEILADDVNGPVKALEDGLILMPLYQPQGADGFFVVQKV